MSQTFEIIWTNPENVVAVPVALGFEPVQVIVTTLSSGVQTTWNQGMPQGYYMNQGTLETSGGFTLFGRQNPAGSGIPVTAMSLGSNGSTITITPSALTALFPLVAGAQIKVVGTVSTGFNTPLDGIYTIQSVSNGMINLAGTFSGTYNTYVAGGIVIPYTQPCGKAYNLPLLAPITGVIGVSMAGNPSQKMQALFQSAVAVV